MKLIKTLTLAYLAPLLALLLGSCAQYTADNPPPPNPRQKSIPKAVFVNPYPVGSYSHFKADPGYPKTYKTWKNEELFKATPKSLTRIEISLTTQRAVVYRGDEPMFDYPISTGKKQFPTKPGKFKILEMQEAEKRSNLYGKIYDAEGECVNSDADVTVDPVPEGGKFEGALMRYWMRITWGGIGMHQGRVPRYPASHGCIRTPRGVVAQVFKKVKLGTPVSIIE